MAEEAHERAGTLLLTTCMAVEGRAAVVDLEFLYRVCIIVPGSTLLKKLLSLQHILTYVCAMG